MENTKEYLKGLFADDSDTHYSPEERKEHNAHIEKAIQAFDVLEKIMLWNDNYFDGNVDFPICALVKVLDNPPIVIMKREPIQHKRANAN